MYSRSDREWSLVNSVIGSIDPSSLACSCSSFVVAIPTCLEHVDRGCKRKTSHATVTSCTMQSCSYRVLCAARWDTS
jgi:hypothetical protein